MWDGYFTYAGTEIINASRTEAYAASKPWFKAVVNNEALIGLLGDAPYTDPATDLAPWFDPDESASADFLGLYPINVNGIDDSTRSAASVESTVDGGVPGRIRHTMKTPTFNCLLLADSMAGAEYGMRWLRRVLLGAVCSDVLSSQQTLGHDLGYFASQPVRTGDDGGVAQGLRISRYLRRTVFHSGPSILAKHDNLSCGGSVWNVQFGAMVGIPFEFGATRAILQGYLDPSTSDPWAPGTTPGSHSTAPTAFTEVACPDNLWEPLYDPQYPALIVPPTPPSVPLSAYAPPSSWSRYKVTIPAPNIPLWGDVVPLIEMSATAITRNVRLRFYRDADADFDPNDSPCDYIGDVVVSYIPAGASISLDGATQTVLVTDANDRVRRADSLVFRTDGRPFVWPSLSCGYQHILTVDVPSGSTPPALDLGLIPKAV